MLAPQISAPMGFSALPMNKKLGEVYEMSPAQIALMNEAADRQDAERGLGRAQERGLGPDAGTGQVAGGPSGNVITFNVQGTPQAGILAFDQWWFFSLLADQPINNTYAIGVVTVLSEDGAWTPALVALYLGLEPLFLVNANLTAFSDNAALAGSSIRIRRSDPFGSTAGTLQPQSSYQNAADFQQNRGQFPIAEAVDAWTWMRLIAPITVAGTTGIVATFFGPRQDRRADVPRVSPQIVRSVNR